MATIKTEFWWNGAPYTSLQNDFETNHLLTIVDLTEGDIGPFVDDFNKEGGIARITLYRKMDYPNNIQTEVQYLNISDELSKKIIGWQVSR